MEIRDIAAARRFSDDKLVKAGLFATDRLFYDLYCLEPGQLQKVHAHAAADKVYLVLDGRALVTVGNETRELVANQAALAPAGAPHGVRNDSAARVVLLVVTTPPPAAAG